MKGEAHTKGANGKFYGGRRTGEYEQVSSGESHKPCGDKGEFLGSTKGNSDLPTNRTAGVSTGHGGGQHKAGGSSKMSY